MGSILGGGGTLSHRIKEVAMSHVLVALISIGPMPMSCVEFKKSLRLLSLSFLEAPLSKN